MEKETTYRYRAEELRTLSDEFKEQVAKDAMLRLAQEYEQMAEVLESLKAPP